MTSEPTAVGQTLTRISDDEDLPATVVVVGAKGGNWVLTDASGFSAPFEMTPISLHDAYGGDGESVVEVDEPSMYRRLNAGRMRNAGLAANQAADAALAEQESPEAHFRRIETSEATQEANRAFSRSRRKA